MRPLIFTNALLMLAFAFAPTIATAAPAIRSYTVADGLPAARVLAITQSADGTLWVSTEDGLSSFFGGTFRQEPLMPQNVARGSAQALLATPDGSLWVAGDAGVYRRSAKGYWFENIEKESGLDALRYDAFLLDQTGTIWIGGKDGLAWYDQRQWTIVTGDSPGAVRVNALAEDTTGHIWIASPDRIIIMQAERVTAILDDTDGLPVGAEITALLYDSHGTMWVATTGGLMQMAGTTVSRVLRSTDGLPGDAIISIAEDKQGSVWLGTEHGLAEMRAGVILRTISDADGLAGSFIHSIFCDDEGNLWVGTENGMSQINIGTWRTEVYPLLRGKSINALLVNGSAEGIVATSDRVVQRTSSGTWGLISDQTGPIYAIRRDSQGQLWLGGEQGLLRVVNNQLVSDHRLPAGSIVTALLDDRQGYLWVGTHNGLWRFQGEDAPEHLGTQDVLSLWRTTDGDIWVGTLNRGASRFRAGIWIDLQRSMTSNGLADDIVLCGLEDSSGNIWFGTSNGLSRLVAGGDPNDGTAWLTYRSPQLAHDRVNVLWEDIRHPGYVWAATSGGLSLVVNGVVSVFNQHDGLSHKTIYSLGQSVDGTLWIGTALGLDYHLDRGQEPLIRTTVLQVGNDTYYLDYGYYSEQRNGSSTASFDDFRSNLERLAKGVPYTTKMARLQYAGSDLGDLDGLRYRVTTISSDGVSPTISPLTSETFFEPKKLSAGLTYTFTIQAIDRDFNISEPTQPIVLRINWPTPLDQVRDNLLIVLPLAMSLSLTIGAIGYRYFRSRSRVVYGNVTISFMSVEKDDDIHIAISYAPTVRQQLFPWLFPPVMKQLLNHKVDESLIKQVREIYAEVEGGIQTRLADEKVQFRREDQQYIGRLLARIVFGSDDLRVAHKIGLGNHRVRLILKFSDQRMLAHLPWELLYPDDELGFVCRRADTTLIRLFQTKANVPRQRIDKLRVLMVMAQPKESDILHLYGEQQRLMKAIAEKSKFDPPEYVAGPNAIKVFMAQQEQQIGAHSDEERDVTTEQVATDERVLSEEALVAAKDKGKDLCERLQSRLSTGRRWDVLHFVCHAGPDRDALASLAPIVLWSEDRRGDYMALDPDELRDLLKSMPSKGASVTPKLVILNACRTADADSHLIQVILDCGVQAIIGMQWPIHDTAAGVFTEEFYKNFMRFGQVDYAVSVARQRMNKDQPDGWDWAAPLLISLKPDGILFDRS